MLVRVLPTNVDLFWETNGHVVKELVGAGENAERIRVALITSHLEAFVLVNEEKQKIYGSVLVNYTQDEILSKKTMLIYMIIPADDRLEKEVLKEGFLELIEYAKEAGCSGIATYTTEAWSKFLQRFGAVEQRYCYKEI